MKRKWIFQLTVIIAMFALFIFTANRCAAEKDYYSIAAVGMTINQTPVFMPVTTDAIVTMDDETEIITIVVSKDKNFVYAYLLTGLIGRDSDSTSLGASFAAIDPDGKQYFINMRMFTDHTIQLTIADKDATAAFVLFLQEPVEHKGIQAKQDTLRQRILGAR